MSKIKKNQGKKIKGCTPSVKVNRVGVTYSNRRLLTSADLLQSYSKSLDASMQSVQDSILRMHELHTNLKKDASRCSRKGILRVIRSLICDQEFLALRVKLMRKGAVVLNKLASGAFTLEEAQAEAAKIPVANLGCWAYLDSPDQPVTIDSLIRLASSYFVVLLAEE